MSSDSAKDKQTEPQMQSPMEKSKAEKVEKVESLRSVCSMSAVEFEVALEEFDALVAKEGGAFAELWKLQSGEA